MSVRREDCCAACAVAIVPGVLWPMATDGAEDYAYVERCDSCAVFASDEDAAIALSAVVVAPSCEDDDGRQYIRGYTFVEAECYAVGFAVGLEKAGAA